MHLSISREEDFSRRMIFEWVLNAQMRRLLQVQGCFFPLKKAAAEANDGK